MTSENLPAERNQTTALVLLPDRQVEETTRAYVTRLIELLPPADDDVIERIGEQIFAAGNLAEENLIWDSAGAKDAVGKEFIFKSVHLMDSDFEDSWCPYFLICKVTDLETSENTVLTTGSESMVKSLVKAQLLGNLPAQARISGPRKGHTRKGRVPLHITWIMKVGADGS